MQQHLYAFQSVKKTRRRGCTEGVHLWRRKNKHWINSPLNQSNHPNCDWLIDWLIDDRYSPLSWEDSLRSPVVLDECDIAPFYSAFFEYPPKWCIYSAGMAGATWNCSHLGASSVYTIQPCTCHFMQSHICKVYACLAVTCHLHFWQHDWDFFTCYCDTEISQHRKSTLEKKILPLLLGFKS